MAIKPDEVRLLAEAFEGNLVAQRKVFDRWLPLVLAWATRLGGNRIDAEDVTHEVFIVVLTRFETLRDLHAFQGWLYGITVKTVAKYRRRAWLKRWVGAPEREIEDQATSPLADYERAELCQQVQNLLETLPTKQREVLILCDVEERTNREVAELLGIPVGTVASRLRLARKRFGRVAHQRQLEPLAYGGVS